jgi:hypothetical protein
VLRAGARCSSLTAGAPVRRPGLVPLRPGANRLAAAPARHPRPAIDAARAARAHRFMGSSEHAAEVFILDVSDPRPRRELGEPERLGLPFVPDPRDEPLVKKGVADLPLGAPSPNALDNSVEVGWTSMMSGPSRRTDAGIPRLSSRTGPFHWTACQSRPRRTSQGRPTYSYGTGRRCQRPRIRRWLRSTSPSSNQSSKFFPIASTRSRRLPSSSSASPRS